MKSAFDCIVLGVGAMGSAACMHLARRGQRVLGLEQFDIAHGLGSSGGESRVFRLCYYEHPDYVPLLRRALELWQSLQQDSDEQLLFLCGGLYMGSESCDFLRGSLRAAMEHDLPHELLDSSDVRRRFPMFNMPADWVGMQEPNAGALLSERSILAHVQRAVQNGATLHSNERATRWDSVSGRIRVTTDRGVYEAETLIITAGAWTSTMCSDLGVKLQVARQLVGWVQPPAIAPFTPDRFPIWGFDDPAGYFHYGFPALPGTQGIKMARHYAGEPTEIDRVDRSIHPDDVSTIEHIARTVMPSAAGPVIAAKVCLYTNSPDSHFIIDRHPEENQVILACGFSGHGYKFATVIGEVLADLVIDGSTRHPIGFLSMKRFIK